MFQTNHEAFTSRFLARLPPEIAASFSPDQLAAIHYAFGMRYAVGHGVDVRRMVRLPWGSYYFVMLVGRHERNEDRSRSLNPFSSWAGLLTLVVVLGAAALALAG
ncbi:MAG: hypothetical protein JOY71_26755 [Acetobacteraceae bacterium]|nr:hypothetical protein [Acetobacteraceae bacterium]